MQPVNSDAGKDVATPLPERCSKADFAGLLGLHPSAVTRYKTAGRMVFDRRGQVAVRESLARLAATWDPQRGGRKGGGFNAPDGGTLARIEALLATTPKGEAGSLRDELAMMRAELAEARRIVDWYVLAKSEGRVLSDEELHERSASLADALRESFHEAQAAHLAGDRAWGAYVDRLMAVTLWGWSADEALSYVADTYGDA